MVVVEVEFLVVDLVC